MTNYLFVAEDPLGKIVILFEDCYEHHILLEHPDLDDIDEIENTIKTPDHIALDAHDEERLIYYRTYKRQPQRWMIKVVVESNEVITAYRVKRMKEGERVTWRR